MARVPDNRRKIAYLVVEDPSEGNGAQCLINGYWAYECSVGDQVYGGPLREYRSWSQIAAWLEENRCAALVRCDDPNLGLPVGEYMAWGFEEQERMALRVSQFHPWIE